MSSLTSDGNDMRLLKNPILDFTAKAISGAAISYAASLLLLLPIAFLTFAMSFGGKGSSGAALYPIVYLPLAVFSLFALWDIRKIGFAIGALLPLAIQNLAHEVDAHTSFDLYESNQIKFVAPSVKWTGQTVYLDDPWLECRDLCSWILRTSRFDVAVVDDINDIDARVVRFRKINMMECVQTKSNKIDRQITNLGDLSFCLSSTKERLHGAAGLFLSFSGNYTTPPVKKIKDVQSYQTAVAYKFENGGWGKLLAQRFYVSISVSGAAPFAVGASKMREYGSRFDEHDFLKDVIGTPSDKEWEASLSVAQ
jgi:hypothetical protein